jgi:hypothetical protein
MRRLKSRANVIATLACTACAAAGVSADPIGASAPLVQYRLDPGRSGVTFEVANVWHSNLTMRYERSCHLRKGSMRESRRSRSIH